MNDKCGLLASMVLFARLYNYTNYNTVYDLIGLFIKAAVADARSWSLNCTEVTDLVNNTYGFALPESVIRRAIRDTLKGSVNVYGNGRYFFDPRIAADYERLNTERLRIMAIQKEIHLQLFKSIERKSRRPLEAAEKEAVVDELNHYLLDKDTAGKYTQWITDFINGNRKESSFSHYLTSIRTGLIAYQALRFTPDLEELYQWKTPLIIFLSIEHLFNALGYNGKHFLHIFNNSYELVQEINAANKGKGRVPRIQLRFLEVTRNEYQQFFRDAVSILNGEIRPDPDDPSRIAMEKLLNGCNSPSAIEERKVSFEYDLQQKGIELYEFATHPYNYVEFTVDDRDTWHRIRETMTQRWEEQDEDRCLRLLRIFSTVNALRQGKMERRLEDVRYVFLTNQKLGLYLAHETRVDFRKGHIPFAVDIDFLTNALWIKLKKGFGAALPYILRFDVVARTQVALPPVLTAQEVSDSYDSLLDKLDQGSLTEKVALARSIAFRNKSQEDILPDYSGNYLQALGKKSNTENVFRELKKNINENKSLQEENDSLKKELKRFKTLEKIREDNVRRMAQDLMKADYLEERWKGMMAVYRKNARYAARSIALSFIVFAFSAYVNINRRLNDWRSNLGLLQYLFILASASFFTLELAGRSYFFDKERIKNGRRWLKAYFPTKKGYFKIKAEAMEKFEAEFMARNPSPASPED